MAKLTITEISNILEGIIFASSTPVSLDALYKRFFPEDKVKKEEVKKALVHLQKAYNERGIHLVEVATGFRFQAAETVTPYIVKILEEKPARFSRALLETLALIAYRQPITRGEIEEIRGVVVSTHIIKTLDELEWIRIVGHKDVPGKPALYATTKAFLDHFGLKNLEDLPPLAELKDLDKEELSETQTHVETSELVARTSLPLPEEQTEEMVSEENITQSIQTPDLIEQPLDEIEIDHEIA